MKESDTPPAIVSKAEANADVLLGRLARAIAPAYTAAINARRKQRSCGIQIGRAIIEACRSAEVQKQVAHENSKQKKPNGGSATKAHSWVRERFDSVRIFVTRHKDDDDTTDAMTLGSGNMLAQLGQVKEFVSKQDEVTRDQARKECNDDDGEESSTP